MNVLRPKELYALEVTQTVSCDISFSLISLA